METAKYKSSFEIARDEQNHKWSTIITAKVRDILGDHASEVSRTAQSEEINLSVEFWEFDVFSPHDYVATKVALALREVWSFRQSKGVIPMVGIYCEQQINPYTFEPYLRFWALITPL